VEDAVSDEADDRADEVRRSEQGDDLLAAVTERLGPGQQATEERYARPEADHLPDDALAEIAARSTGAREAAFFDLDKTVIARSSTLAMSRTFFRDGLISPTMVVKSLYAQTVYQLVGADHEKMEQMRHAALELTRGWEAERIRRLVAETMQEVLVPLAYQEALDLIAEHRRVGRDVWIISSSGEEIVEPFCRELGVRDFIATRSGIDEAGCYDGTLEFYAYGTAKANAMRQVASARGYDLERCYAYSDSITDLPMLSVVGKPAAVNPDRELRAAATAMGWQVRDFHAPVRLRDRLPDVSMPELQRPRGEVLLGAGVAGALAAGLLAWRWMGRENA
jgi:HAD superfamily hydrolase (TIGR01490 family)